MCREDCSGPWTGFLYMLQRAMPAPCVQGKVTEKAFAQAANQIFDQPVREYEQTLLIVIVHDVMLTCKPSYTKKFIRASPRTSSWYLVKAITRTWIGMGCRNAK